MKHIRNSPFIVPMAYFLCTVPGVYVSSQSNLRDECSKSGKEMDSSFDSRSSHSSTLSGSTMRGHRQDDLLIRRNHTQGSSTWNRLSSRSCDNGMVRSDDVCRRKDAVRTLALLFVCNWIENDFVWGIEWRGDSS